MRFVTPVCVALALAAAYSLAVAGEIKSGLEPGSPIGAFDVVKCSGASEDGVAVGQQLCYRCKYGKRPMVMVFARSTDGELATLIKKLDEAVAANGDKNLKAFVNVMGSDREAAEATANKLGSANVPSVVPVEFENGPANYGINPKAGVTVILASESKVVANYAVDGALSASDVEAIVAQLPKLLQ